MTEPEWVPLRTAWEQALYGDQGFYRRHQPADHFRTSPQVSTCFAEAVVALVHHHGLTGVWDIGAGAGELLTHIRRIDPRLALTAVEVRERPEDLAPDIGWQHDLPTAQTGLVFANELLDNLPCDVVECDIGGVPRLVEVQVGSGVERLGGPVSAEGREWLATWWPLSEPGQRAEVGLTRDRLWARVCQANPEALVVSIDYGHQLADRPSGGSLSSYRGGVQTTVRYDGRHDLTAHVAVDSLTTAVGGTVRRQRDVLDSLGVAGSRPPLETAHDDPAGYLRNLAQATQRAELIATGGLGDFWWVLREPAT